MLTKFLEMLGDIHRWYMAQFRMIGRIFFWGWHLRNSYDWDYIYLDEIIYLKLKRMKRVMESDPYRGEGLGPKKRAWKALLRVIHILGQENFDIKTQFPDVYFRKAKFAKDKREPLFREISYYDLDLSQKQDDLFDKRRKEAYELIIKWRRHWWT